MTALTMAKRSLKRGLQSLQPNVQISANGYVESIEDNLLPGIGRDLFEADLQQGDGNELESKFRAAYSSSALAVNCFAPFKNDPASLTIAGQIGFEAIRFEAKCPTGLRGGRAPNLDLLAESDNVIVGVESKCTEYLQQKSWAAEKPPFRRAYFDQIRDERRKGKWFEAMMQISLNPDSFRYLDVAQLVKHAFGLGKVYRGKRVILLYLYWEPIDADRHEEFELHHKEIERFSEMVSDGFPEFDVATYEDLFAKWTGSNSRAWIRGHVENLRSRYTVSLGVK